METEPFVDASDWLTELFAERRAEIEDRRLEVRFEIEPGYVIRRVADFESAFRNLVALVLETVPDECEIFVEAGREAASVSRLGAGIWTIRWQRAEEAYEGEEDRDSAQRQSNVIVLRPDAGSSRSADPLVLRAARLHRDFEAAGWAMRLDRAANTDEMIARVWRH